METAKKVTVMSALNAYKEVLQQKWRDAGADTAEEMVISAELRKVEEARDIVRES